MDPFYREDRGGWLLRVRVTPRSSRTQVTGCVDGVLRLKVQAPPVEGAANEELIGTLSAALRVPRRGIRIVAGDRGRHKRVLITGLTAAAANARLGIA